MKKAYVLLLMLTLFSVSCIKGNPSDIPTEGETNPPSTIKLSMVDKNATTQTKALYSQLWAIQSKGFMFGHHDDLWYGRKWYNKPEGSDTKDVCGDYPAVFGVDFAEIMDDRCLTSTSQAENAIRKRCILEARSRGEVILACCHLNNPLTDGDAWDNSNNKVVKEILTEGSATNIRFKTWLDRLAIFAAELKDDKGNLIPIIFRPFHEHTQTWSWWGQSCTTKEEFIGLWKFTVNYLRDTKGVHQFIYAISPQMDVPKTKDDFLFRWPGDDYVDFIGMDCYHGLNPSTFTTNLNAISTVSKEKMKPCGVTETGVEGFKDSDYWTKQILTPATGQAVSMIVMWRNKYDPQETGTHYYSVFQGHPSVSNFIKMYNSPISLFSKDLPDMYKMADGITIN
ncbi:glycoside hydrolase family 26 protein [Bacteroides sedimenti]